MRLIPLLLALVACPKPQPVETPAPDAPAPEPAPASAPAEAPAAVVPIDGPALHVAFAYADGQTARLSQTLIEQSSIPGVMANRVTIESQQRFEVRAEGDNFALRQDVEQVDVLMEAPPEVAEPLGAALGRALQVSPKVIVDAAGEVQDVILPEDQIAAAHADVQAIADEALEIVRAPILAAAEALLDPQALTTASERGVSPWNLGELTLAFQAQLDEPGRLTTFLGWVPCTQEDTEPACGAVLVQLDEDDTELAEVLEVLEAQFAELPDEQRPAIGEVHIDEQYLFVLEAESGRVRRSAHDKRTTAVITSGTKAVPYVKNLATAELWTWE